MDVQNVAVSEMSVAPGWQRRRQILFDEYERVAITLFAERGYRSVTVEEIAETAGVSGRTLFRYFPTKEDFLLGFHRRMLESTLEAVAALAPSSTPLQTVWAVLRAQFDETGVGLDPMNLWRTAAAEAPDVVARVRGERQEGLLDAVSEYCAASLAVDPSRDARPRLYAGMIAGADMAIIELWGRSELTRVELARAADELFEALSATL